MSKPDDEVIASFKQVVHFLCNKGITVYLDELNYGQLIEQYFDEFTPYINSLNVSANNSHDNMVGKLLKIERAVLPLIDLIITLGGDGLLMHCNTLFESKNTDFRKPNHHLSNTMNNYNSNNHNNSINYKYI